jgi:hypothetical protein
MIPTLMITARFRLRSPFFTPPAKGRQLSSATGITALKEYSIHECQRH